MPMRFLENLTFACLPIKVDDADDIEKCCVLHAAQLITAYIPPYLVVGGRVMFAGHAIVSCVTPNGIAASARRSHTLPDPPEVFPSPKRMADGPLSDRS